MISNSSAPGRNGRRWGPNGRHGEQRPVLITGGAGFIGTNLAHSFASQGRPVYIYDNLSRKGVEDNVTWLLDKHGDLVNVFVADVLDEHRLRLAVEQAGIIFHLAAQVAVTTSVQDPKTDFQINARGTLNVLEACRRLPSPPPLLFTSTNKVYGNLEDIGLLKRDDQYQPADPEIRQRGISEARCLDLHGPYGCSKGAADQYVRDYARCFGLPTVVLRMSCIYGPHQYGTEDQGWVAHFARAVLNGDSLNIYGDGAQVRDLLYIDDLVAAMRLAVKHIDRTRGRVFNIGGGPQNAASVLQVIRLLSELNHGLPHIEFGHWRPGDQRYYVSDFGQFSDATGWKPNVGTSQGIRQLFRWLGQEFPVHHAVPA